MRYSSSKVKLFIMLGVIYDSHFRGLVIYNEIIIIRGGWMFTLSEDIPPQQIQTVDENKFLKSDFYN